MTEDQIQFRNKFKHIVWLKSQVTNARQKVEKLSRYDKNGSHTSAIKKAIDSLNSEKEIFNGALEGKTYEDWKAESKQVSVAIEKQRRAQARLNKK